MSGKAVLEASKQRLKKTLIFFLKVAVSAGIIGFTVYNLDLDAIGRLWLTMDIGWVALSLLLVTLSYFFGALQWRYILEMAQFRLSYLKVLGYYYVGLFFNNFLISGMGGDFMRIYDIHQHSADRERLSPALATVLFDRFVGLITLIFLACLMGMVAVTRGESPRLVAGIGIMFASWVVLIIALFNKKTAEWTIKPLTKWMPQKIYVRFQHLYYEIHRFGSARRSLVCIFAVSILVQLQRILAIWAIGRALGDTSSVRYYIIFVPLMSIAASLPISIGGTGPREQTTIHLFRRLGVSQEIAFSIGFLAYVVSMITTVPGALLFIIRKGKTRHA